MTSQENTPYSAYNIGGSLVSRDAANVLVGKLLTYTEATFQDKEQREAHKTLIKEIVHKWFDSYQEFGTWTTEFQVSEKGAPYSPVNGTWTSPNVMGEDYRVSFTRK